jgi:cell division septation protein DedD
MDNQEKKTLLWRYVGSFVLLAITIIVLAIMYKQAQKDDEKNKAALNSTQVTTEYSSEYTTK